MGLIGLNNLNNISFGYQVKGSFEDLQSTTNKMFKFHVLLFCSFATFDQMNKT
jgi:hypothetical protein